MNLYTKTDLIFQDYYWTTTEDASKLNGDPDRNLFTSTEGNEVLYMVNCLMKDTGLTAREDGEMIERLIHDKLPIGKQSQVTAKRWLQEKMEATSTVKN